MNFDEVNAAVSEAEHTLRLVDRMANRMARMLVGRLAHVDNYVLKSLKKELERFNAHTGKWRG